MLLDRFDLTAGPTPCARTGPRAVSLVPAALRMVLHSDLTRDDLASIRAVTSGTAPLSADDADAFTEKFGIPVLTSYAATEFGGGVAGWTLADHQRYWQAKRGSVGRATPGAQLRVVDDDGTPLGPDQPGLLEVKPGQLGPSADWMRTTDMARIDDDGFLWILGRADQAIIRGGFKVMPDDVRIALESHPAVQGAAVVGPPRRPPRRDPGRHGRTAPRRRRHAGRTAGVPAKPGWPATRFPPRSSSSTPSPARRRASPIWTRYGGASRTHRPRHGARMPDEPLKLPAVVRRSGGRPAHPSVAGLR